MNDDLISRTKAKEEIFVWARDLFHPERLSTEDTMWVLDHLPAADEQPETSEWIPWESGGKVHPVLVTCSKCKRGQWNKNTVWEFVRCPKCGAKMRRMEK